MCLIRSGFREKAAAAETIFLNSESILAKNKNK